MSNHRLIPEDIAKRTSVTIDKTSHEALLHFGEGNLSLGIRRAVALAIVAPTQGADARPVAVNPQDVAEMCAKFAELYWTDHGAGGGVEDACNAIAEACRDWAVNHVATRDAAPSGSHPLQHWASLIAAELLGQASKEDVDAVEARLREMVGANAPREKT